MNLVNLSEAELATVLAALRFWQSKGQLESATFGLQQIATNEGLVEPLDSDQIDDLCEKINTDEA